MGYLKSEEVKAFPLAKPRWSSSNDITSRIFYEQNVSNIIRQIIDVDGFIISDDSVVSEFGIVNSDSTLCIDLYGYYFEIASNVNLPETAGATEDSKEVWVGIQVSEKVGNEPQEIIGQDTTDGYTGLEFSASKFGSEYKCFQLLEKVTSEESGAQKSVWRLVKPSYRKFDIDSLCIDWIDAKRQ